MRAKKRISVLLTVCLVMTMLPVFSFGAEASNQEGSVSVAELTDITGHWATKAITRWVDFGVIKGDSRGFRPDAPITRAELAVMLERLMGYQKRAENHFSDVGSGDWFADPVLKAQAAGILTGDGKGHAMPSSNVTREQAAVMLFRAFGAEAAPGGNSSFVDTDNISSWARTAVFGLEDSKFIGGMADGSFQPKADITRAQFVTMIDNAVCGYYNKPGTYTDAVSSFGDHSIAVINSDGVKLKGVTIKGDLILAEGIGEGSVTLDAVHVDGRLIARGGGKNSVHIINGSQVNGKVIVERTDGAVRIVSDGVTIATLDANTEVILEGSFADVTALDGAKVEVRGDVKTLSVDAKAEVSVTEKAVVNTLSIDKNAGGSSLTVSGTVGTISAAAPDMKIKVGDTAKIKKIDLAKSAEGAELSLGKKAEVATLNSDAGITISGSGTPGSITGAGTVKTKEPAAGGGGGGGGGGSAGGGDSGGQPDTVKPSLTTGQAVQIGETQASITFKSSEAGTYYYQVVDLNASEPAISTSVNGTACTTAETSITVSIVTVPRDIYIKVKDAAGNVSDSLRMVVPGRQLAPTGLEGIAPTSYMADNGRITGVNTTMEYKQSSDSEAEYQAVEGSSVEGLAPGEYDVRYSKKTDYFAGAAASITVPEPDVTYMCAVVLGFAEGDGFDDSRVRLFNEYGFTRTYILAEDAAIDAEPGQIAVCVLNTRDEIELLAQPESAATSDITRISKDSIGWTLSAGDKEYGILNNAVVFTYGDALPGEAGCRYNISTMEYLKYGTGILKPVSYLFAEEGDEVFLLLIPESEVTVSAPQNLKGIAPTSVDGRDGQITGVTVAMEYRAEDEGENDYKPVKSGSTVIESLVSGIYYVRYAETEQSPAGPDTEVVVPQFVVSNQYGLVTVVKAANAFDNMKLRLLKADATQVTLYLEDGETAELKAGQLIAYGVSEDGFNWSIDDSKEPIVSFASQNITVDNGGMTMTDGNNIYDIADDVAVFTYRGPAPGAEGQDYYGASTIDLVKSSISSGGTADFPFIIYLDEEEKVAAMLISESFLVDEEDQEVYGVFNTRERIKTDGVTIYRFTGFIDGAAFTKNTDNNDIEFNGKAGVFGVYKIIVDTNDVITSVAELDSAPVISGTKASGIVAADKVINDINSDRTVITAGSDRYTIADNAIVYKYDAVNDKFSVDELSSLKKDYTVSLYDTKGAAADGVVSVVIYIENESNPL
jgi:hypothetical protein